MKEITTEYEIDAISLRMFNAFGVGQNDQYYGVVSKFIENISKDKPIVISGDGKQTRDFIGILDVVEAFNRAIKNIKGKKGDAYKIGTGESVTINELVKMILKITDKKIK